MYTPVALFELPKDASAADPAVPAPIAIKIFAAGAEPIFVPRPGRPSAGSADDMWRKAKVIVDNAGTCGGGVVWW